LKTTNFSFVLCVTIFTVIIGALGFSAIENKSFTDGLWWSFVTLITVGYGDIHLQQVLVELLHRYYANWHVLIKNQ